MLADDVNRDAIDEALFAAGLSLVNIVSESASHPHQLIAVGDGAQATFVTDARLGLRWVVLDGERAEALGAALGASLACVGWEAIEASAASAAPDEQVWALTRSVGFLNAEASAPLIERALGSSERRVRVAALVAAAYLPCAAVAALARAHADMESDPELATLARGLADTEAS